ncbi:MAG: hypothetical protein HQ539_01975 [Parcubacteria group bacterium]|nr:hypothetical protein [Parcubacteria group bacterium]
MKTQALSLNLPFQMELPEWLQLGFMLKVALGLVAVTVVMLLGLYVYQIGDLLAKSFAIKDYEMQMDVLGRENSNLAVKAVGPSSLRQIEQKVSELNFVKAGQVRYIPIHSEQLVSK